MGSRDTGVTEGKQEVGTPPLLITNLRATLLRARVLIDLAADDKLHVTSSYVTSLFDELPLLNSFEPLTRFEEDGWFLNPPWKQSARFIRRALELRQEADNSPDLAALVPAALGCKWWRELVINPTQRPDVFFPTPRVRFVGYELVATRETAILLWTRASNGKHNYWNWETGQIY